MYLNYIYKYYFTKPLLRKIEIAITVPCPFYFSAMKLTLCSISVAVILLDTTGEASLEWTRFPYGPQASTPGVSYLIILSRVSSVFKIM